MSEIATLEALVQRMDDALDEHPAQTTLAIARKMANDTGLVRYQLEQESLLEQFGAAQELKRSADHKLTIARESLADLVADAEWELASRFTSRSNKTWLAVDADGMLIPEDDQRSMTADEKKAWIARASSDLPEVRAAAKAVRAAEEHVRECADHIALIDRSLSAVKHALDAAREHLVTVRAAITNTKGAK